MNNGDGYYGILLHCCKAGKEGLGFFHLDGEDYVVIFFSRAQGRRVFDWFSSCFSPEERERNKQELNDPKGFPKHSRRHPIVIGGAAAQTLCKHWTVFQDSRFFSRIQNAHLVGANPRIIAFLHPPIFDVAWKGPKSTIIGARDAVGKYHVFITFSDEETRCVLHRYANADEGLAYERLLSLSPVPSSHLPTIHLGGTRGGVSAHDLCLCFEIVRATERQYA